MSGPGVGDEASTGMLLQASERLKASTGKPDVEARFQQLFRICQQNDRCAHGTTFGAIGNRSIGTAGNQLEHVAINWDRWQSIETSSNQLGWYSWQSFGTVGNQLGQLAMNWDRWQSIGTVGNQLGRLAINWDQWQSIGTVGNQSGQLATIGTVGTAPGRIPGLNPGRIWKLMHYYYVLRNVPIYVSCLPKSQLLQRSTVGYGRVKSNSDSSFWILMTPGLCVVCLDPGDCKRCACGAGWYCGRACQKLDWASSVEPHRDVCPMERFKGICDDNHIPSSLRKKILSFLRKPAHGGD